MHTYMYIPVYLLIYHTFRSGPERFLHRYPQYFTFKPPVLGHTVVFNVSQVMQAFAIRLSVLSFNCGFMDGDDDTNIVNSSAVSVMVQEGVLCSLT